MHDGVEDDCLQLGCGNIVQAVEIKRWLHSFIGACFYG